MTINAPSSTVSFGFAPLAGDTGESAVLIAEIDATGTGTPGEPLRVSSFAQAADYFGPLSQGKPAARRWFSLGLSTEIELYVFGLDSTGWTSNNWTLTAAGTATAAGTEFVRLGPNTISVAIPSGTTAAAAAALVDVAITAVASTVPFTSGVAAEVVTATTTLVGATTNRINVSVNKYADRGESGVPGITWTVVNSAAGTGETAALDTTNLATTGYLWYLHNQVNTAFLDSLATWRDPRWNQENNWFQPIASYATDAEVDFTSVIDLRNDTNHTYLAQSDVPDYELEFTVSVLRAIKDEQAERGTVPISTENRPISGQSPTVIFDATNVLRAGGSAFTAQNGQTLSVQIVNSRREADGFEDLRFFGLELVLSARELSARILADMNANHRGRAILEAPAFSADQASYVTSELAALASGRTVLVQAWKDAIITAPDKTTAESYLLSVTTESDGGVLTGFRWQFSPRLTSIARTMAAFILLRGSAQ